MTKYLPKNAMFYKCAQNFFVRNYSLVKYQKGFFFYVRPMAFFGTGFEYSFTTFTTAKSYNLNAYGKL